MDRQRFPSRVYVFAYSVKYNFASSLKKKRKINAATTELCEMSFQKKIREKREI